MSWALYAKLLLPTAGHKAPGCGVNVKCSPTGSWVSTFGPYLWLFCVYLRCMKPWVWSPVQKQRQNSATNTTNKILAIIVHICKPSLPELVVGESDLQVCTHIPHENMHIHTCILWHPTYTCAHTQTQHNRERVSEHWSHTPPDSCHCWERLEPADYDGVLAEVEVKGYRDSLRPEGSSLPRFWT